MSFKRYFLGHFVDNSDIFTTAVIGPGSQKQEDDFDFLFQLHCVDLFALIIFVRFLSPCTPPCQLQLKLCRDATLVEDMSWENESWKARRASVTTVVTTSPSVNTWLYCRQLTTVCKSPLNFQKILFLFFKCHGPWTLWRFEINWVNFYSDNLNDFAQVFIIRNILSLHGGLGNSLYVMYLWNFLCHIPSICRLRVP